jgi:hypothetical protein
VDCISLKLASESEPFKQFSQFYPVSVLPSTYFIGQSGFPLEIVLGSVDANSLVAKLKKAADVSSQQKMSVIRILHFSTWHDHPIALSTQNFIFTS